MVAKLSRAGLRRIGGFSDVALGGRSVVGVYHVWKRHDMPLAEAILRTRALGFDVSLTSVYDDAVEDGMNPSAAREMIVVAVLEIDGPPYAAAINMVLEAAELMRSPQ